MLEVIQEFQTEAGKKQVWLEDTETGELVITDNYFVKDGDCVSPEFDELFRLSRTACELAKQNTSRNRPYSNKEIDDIISLQK